MLQDGDALPARKNVSESEASLYLDMANRVSMNLMPGSMDFLKRITREWFDARRAAGLVAYSTVSLVEAVDNLRNANKGERQNGHSG